MLEGVVVVPLLLVCISHHTPSVKVTLFGVLQLLVRGINCKQLYGDVRGFRGYVLGGMCGIIAGVSFISEFILGSTSSG